MRQVRLDASGLTEVLRQIFAAAGADATEATAIAENLVAANLAGHDSHGVVRTARYCGWARDGILKFGQHVSTIVDGGSFVLLDGNFGFGQTLGIEAVGVGLEKVRETGCAVVGLRNAGHLGRIGGWAEMAAKEGIVSVHFVNVAQSLLVAPYGGAERRFGTDPVAIGVPCEGGDFILDFATSKVAEGKVLVAQKSGKALPKGSLVTADGVLTEDPVALYGETATALVPDPRVGAGALVAMGDHKGSGLALACELLAGALTGSGTCGPGGRVHNGMLSIYIDPARLDDGFGWGEGVRAYLDYVRACRPADPEAPVMTPGDPERARGVERRRDGLPLSTEVWDSILNSGVTLGLDRDTLAALATKD